MDSRVPGITAQNADTRLLQDHAAHRSLYVGRINEALNCIPRVIDRRVPSIVDCTSANVGETKSKSRLPKRQTGIRDQISRLLVLDEQIQRIEQRITDWRRGDEACRRISEIPAVGLLTATAAVAVIGNAQAFRSGREFAAYLGLVPRQNGSGGKVKLGGISKRGDVYLRTLLIHGARSVISSSKNHRSTLT